MSEELRAFIAVPLPEALRSELRRAITELKREPWAEGVRWVEAANLHLTLRFLGKVAVEAIPGLLSAVTEAVAPLAPFQVEVRGIGLFPSARRPHALAVEVEAGAEGMALAAAVEGAVVVSGLPAAERAFSRAHITLGRLRRRSRGRPIVSADLDPLPFPVEAAVLYRSELRPTGAVYSELGQMPLRGVAGDR